VHVYNNLYTQTQAEGFSYFWGVGREAHLYVENNYLELANGVDPADVVALWTDPTTDLQAGMTEIGTVVNRKKVSVLAAYNAAADPARRILRDAGWEPVLHGKIDPANSLPARVRLQAGAGVLW
jgi:pectate lyase